MLEATIKKSSPQNIARIKKNLRSFGTRPELQGFFSELFLMQRLVSKRIEFEYTPNKQGVDFILPTLESLHIEVTSRQAESWDGRSEAMIRWEECLPVFKTGLYLLLIDAKKTSEVIDKYWLEGFESFESYTKERKGCFQLNEKILPVNKTGIELAHLIVKGIDNDLQKPTFVEKPLQVGSPDLHEKTQNLIRIITNKIREKVQKNQSEYCLVFIDFTHCSAFEEIPLSDSLPHCRTQVKSSLETELKNCPNVSCLTLFRRNFYHMNIEVLLSILNPSSTLAKDNPELYRKSLEIFQ